MPRLDEICRYVRSKNAGPFWVTVDLFFRDRATFDLYSDSPALNAASLAQRLDADPFAVKLFRLPDLMVVKLSYPRRTPQGGDRETDMHGGQQYSVLLDLEVTPAPTPC